MISADHLWILAVALILDAIIGDPGWLWRRVPHPVAAFGRLIDVFDRTWNRESDTAERRRDAGLVTVLALVAAAVAAGFVLQNVFDAIAYGWIATAVVAAVMLAGRSLYDHVAAVAAAHETAGLAAARTEVAKIVGRDPNSLDEPGVSRAAIESLAENFSDGLVAPAFWFALLGMPGLLAYKAINTADSMIGHRSPRYREFGRASARLDDVANWLPARLSAAVIALAAPMSGGSVSAAWRLVGKDARKHRSSNAGWPEAAMAGALGVSLSGPRSYGGGTSDDPFVNRAGREPVVSDIRRALRVYAGAWASVLLIALVLSLAV